MIAIQDDSKVPNGGFGRFPTVPGPIWEHLLLAAQIHLHQSGTLADD